MGIKNKTTAIYVLEHLLNKILLAGKENATYCIEKDDITMIYSALKRSKMEVQILINGVENDGSEVSENITDIEEAIEYLQQLLDRNPS